MRTIICLAALLTAGALTGCQKTGSGGVAVVNLDTIAQAMGWMDQLNQQLQTAGAELQTQLEQLTQNAVATIERAKEELATEAKLTADQIAQLNQITDVRDLEKLPLTAAQREKLVGTLNQVNFELQNARNNVQPLLQQHRTRLVLAYREQVQPIARAIAQQQGFSVVLLQDEGVLYHDPNTADITAEVIRELRAQPGAAAAPFTTGAAP